MATNPTNVKIQMQQSANYAVIVAREKFGVNLDFTENNLEQLDNLLQQAYEYYKPLKSDEKSTNLHIEKNVRVWGGYFGEVIRRNLGGEWIIDQKYIFLKCKNQRVDPLGEVRSRIIEGSRYKIQLFFERIKTENQINLIKQQNQSYNSLMQTNKKTTLIECPDCGNQISREAEFCPHCGKPSSVVRCPICKSTDITKKSTGMVALIALSSIYMAGPFARPPKQYSCNNCKHSW